MVTWPIAILIAALVVALMTVCGAWLVGLWYRRDEKQEDQDKFLMDLASRVQQAEMPHLYEIVKDVAAHDWDGLYRDAYALAKRANEPGALLALLEPNFGWQLPHRVKDEKWVKIIRDMLPAETAAPSGK